MCVWCLTASEIKPRRQLCAALQSCTFVKEYARCAVSSLLTNTLPQPPLLCRVLLSCLCMQVLQAKKKKLADQLACLQSRQAELDAKNVAITTQLERAEQLISTNHVQVQQMELMLLQSFTPWRLIDVSSTEMKFAISSHQLSLECSRTPDNTIIATRADVLLTQSPGLLVRFPSLPYIHTRARAHTRTYLPPTARAHILNTPLFMKFCV